MSQVRIHHRRPLIQGLIDDGWVRESLSDRFRTALRNGDAVVTVSTRNVNYGTVAVGRPSCKSVATFTGEAQDVHVRAFIDAYTAPPSPPPLPTTVPPPLPPLSPQQENPKP